MKPTELKENVTESISNKNRCASLDKAADEERKEMTGVFLKKRETDRRGRDRSAECLECHERFDSDRKTCN